MKRNFLLPAIIIIICAAAGYGIGTLIGNFIMKNKDNTAKTYIGPSTIEIPDGQMTPEVLLALGRLSDPQLSPDGSRILFGVSYTSIEENSSCRNLFICDTDGSNRTQLTQETSSLNNARWSKDGKQIYFIQKGQLFKADLNGDKLGRFIKLSDIPAGMGEFKISPDECDIMYTSTIHSAVQTPSDFDPALDKAQAYVTEDLMYRHWDHWVTETPRTYVSALNGNTITPDNSFDILGTSELFELPTEPFGGIEQLSWAPDSRHIAYSCRKLTGKEYAFSTNSNIYIYDIITGETIAVTNKGGYDTDPSWSPDGSTLAWISMERDGYEADRQRLMAASIEWTENPSEGQANTVKVGTIREITKDFKYDVAGIFWTGNGGEIIFPSTMDGIGALLRVDTRAGEPSIERLTDKNWWFGFDTPFGINGNTIYTSYASMEFPTELVAVKAGQEPSFERITHENDSILDKVAPITQESIWLKSSNGEDLHCWVIYPPHFDSTKVYPAIEMLNGGPQTSLDQSWSYRWNFRLMAQQGYVVILPNRHGDSGFGQEWKEQISGDYCGLNMEDYLIAGRYIKGQPYVGKLAAVGASYGGYSVYMLEGLHGDLYDCFIAHAGIFDEKMLWYTTEEMWFANWDNGGMTEYAYSPGQTGPAGDGTTFGGMQQAGSPYSSSALAQKHYSHSPSSMVTNWHTPILCMHGMMDYRIPYEQGMAAFNAAQMMGVPSKLVVFPTECHWILEPQNALFWHRTFFDWLEKWTK